MLSSSATTSPQRGTHGHSSVTRENDQPTVQTSDTSLPAARRLIVDHIVLDNFKSYAGRQVIGPFHKNFTSIVGPNGSGKSNVIDAFMFVLGYRAKKLRQSKLAELIHNSEGMLDVESCTVEVHFSVLSGDDNSAVERLVVSRTAHRNNTNKYFVNGHVSSYSDVIALLKSFGVDLDHKRFLILQGEVESIAQMKPKAATEHEEGLLEYLEDIIGTNMWIEHIEAAGKAVDVANDQCAEKQVRVKAAEREVHALAQEKNTAESYIRQENQLVMQKANLYQILRFQAESQTARLTEKLEHAREKLAAEVAVNEAKSAESDELEQRLKTAANTHVDLEKQSTIAARQLSQLEKEGIKLQETRKHLKTKIKGLERSLADESRAKSNLEHELQELDQEMRTLAETVTGLEGELTEGEKTLQTITEGLRDKTGELQLQLEQLQKQMAPWNEKMRQEQDALESAVLALSVIERKQRIQDNEQSDTETRLETVRAELEAALQTRTTQQQRREVLRAELAQHQSEIAAGETIQASLVTAISTIQSTLSEANEALRQNNNGNSALNGLMKEAAAGRIKGIFGRLGDLGIIDSKYDIAISTACSSLNHIVVDSTATGQKCVEFLRRGDLGRASFIILEKMRPVDARPQLPANAVRLFDLVQVKDERFRCAFYFALNDTLVAATMNEASELAHSDRRRFRVVTLDGKLFDTSGTMSGGGSVQQGGMKTAFAPEISREQLEELDRLLSAKQAEQRTVKTGLMQFQELHSKTQIELKRVEMELGKAEIACRSLPVQVADLTASLATLKVKDRKPSQSESDKMERLRAQVREHELALQELRDCTVSIQQAIDACQAQILEAGGTTFKVQRSKVNDLRAQLKLQEKRLMKLSTQKTSMERKRDGGTINEEHEAELRTLEETLAMTSEQIEAGTLETFKAKQDCERLAVEMDESRGELDRLKGEQVTLAKQLAKFRRLEFEMKSEMERVEGELEEQARLNKASQLAFSQLKFNSIKLHDAVTPEIAIYEADELAEMTRTVDQLRATIRSLEDRLAQQQPNLKVIEEYRMREETFRAMRDELLQLEATRDAHRNEYETLRKRRHDEFMTGFRQISLRLKELYQLITMGGNAELELVDSLDPFSEGILFSVMPPKKSWKNIANLSGGEKTLSSLALVFALHTFKPTPIYVMDEIDAALDFRNVSIVGNYIKERTRDAQFIVISLRNNMFELADRLVGIYKTNQRTKSVAIDPATFSVGAFIQGHPQAAQPTQLAAVSHDER